ncbi:MAG: ribonuclease P protein component [Flavobacteriaceae bacterium]|jgi:ribonuclease P protein component
MTQKHGLEKLKSKIRIDLVFKKGKAVRSGALILHFFNPKEEVKKPHLGVGVPKKSIPMAYRRNRIKRQIRAVILQQEKEVLDSLPPGFYMVLYKGKFGVSSKSLSQDFQGLIKSFVGQD